MKNKKTRLYPAISAIDKQYLEHVCEKEAEKGWMVSKIKGAYVTFQKSETCKRDFSISVFQPTSPIDYTDLSKEEDFHDIITDSGWVLHASNERFHIFSKDRKTQLTDIQTEPSIEYQNIKTSIMKSELSLLLLLLINIFVLFMSFTSNTYQTFISSSLIDTYVLNTVLFGFMSLTPLVWLFRNRQNAKENERLNFPTAQSVKLKQAFITLLLLLVLTNLILQFSNGNKFLLGFLIPFALLVIGSLYLDKFLRKRQFGKGLTIAIYVVITVFFLQTMMFSVIGTFVFSNESDTEISITDEIKDEHILLAEDFGYNGMSETDVFYTNRSLLISKSYEYYFTSEQENFMITYIKPRTHLMHEFLINKIKESASDTLDLKSYSTNGYDVIKLYEFKYVISNQEHIYIVSVPYEEAFDYFITHID